MKLNLKNESILAFVWFNLDPNKQANEVKFSRAMAKSLHPQICFINILDEQEIEFKEIEIDFVQYKAVFVLLYI